MRVTLVACGSRGDVQPMLALALGLQRAGHDALLTVPPDFGDWAGAYDCPVRVVGPGFRGNPEMRGAGLRSFARFTRREVSAEIRALPDMARGSHLIVATGLALAAHSVAEHLRIPYRLVTFAPLAMMGTSRDPLWMKVAARFARAMANANLRALLNRERAALGLPPIRDVMASWAGEHPISATDRALTLLPEGAIPNSTQMAYMQFQWASLVARLGLGPRVGLLRTLSARRLAAAITECLSSPSFAARAREVASALAAGPDGVALTVKQLERDDGRTR